VDSIISLRSCVINVLISTCRWPIPRMRLVELGPSPVPDNSICARRLHAKTLRTISISVLRDDGATRFPTAMSLPMLPIAGLCAKIIGALQISHLRPLASETNPVRSERDNSIVGEPIHQLSESAPYSRCDNAEMRTSPSAGITAWHHRYFQRNGNVISTAKSYAGSWQAFHRTWR